MEGARKQISLAMNDLPKREDYDGRIGEGEKVVGGMEEVREEEGVGGIGDAVKGLFKKEDFTRRSETIDLGAEEEEEEEDEVVAEEEEEKVLKEEQEVVVEKEPAVEPLKKEESAEKEEGKEEEGEEKQEEDKEVEEEEVEEEEVEKEEVEEEEEEKAVVKPTSPPSLSLPSSPPAGEFEEVEMLASPSSVGTSELGEIEEVGREEGEKELEFSSDEEDELP
jgi:hypothetical protein